MTTLYRTPNLIIDAHEWHAVVRLTGTRVSLCYRWRPLSVRECKWSSIAIWKGLLPKGMCGVFWPFKTHIRMAMDSEKTRREAFATLRGRPNGATMRNPGNFVERRIGRRAGALLRVA